MKLNLQILLYKIECQESKLFLELQCSRRMPKWQYVCDVLCFAGQHKTPSKGQ